jgi:hypothetical protein
VKVDAGGLENGSHCSKRSFRPSARVETVDQMQHSHRYVSDIRRGSSPKTKRVGLRGRAWSALPRWACGDLSIEMCTMSLGPVGLGTVVRTCHPWERRRLGSAE